MVAPAFVDIHCHLAPGIDDGSKSWDETRQMAQIAVADGIEVVVCTPHQLGNYSHNDGAMIRQRVDELQNFLDDNRIPLTVLPGADVRIEDGMIGGLNSGDVLSLADHRRHILLELPHELYFPLEGVLEDLHANGMVGILSHPERNQGILQTPEVLAPLVEQGCLMQVTAGSLIGSMGPRCQQFSEWMLEHNLVHFLATDAHGPKSRRPLMRRAFERASQLVGDDVAVQLCCDNPLAVAEGDDIEVTAPLTNRRRSWTNWIFGRRAA